MNKITVDAATAEKFKEIAPGTELCGPDGSPIAGVIPLEFMADVKRWLERIESLYERDDDNVTLEELQAVEAAGGGIPHEEVIKRLGLE
ncbi:MAG: hypothetical protein K2P78_09205 [Gemmataceae bacterium]|nr:hypothetical protein [Gemmataceae bacterium]